MKHPREVNKLISALQRLIRVLKEEEMTDWREHFMKSEAMLRRGDYHSAKRHILEVYGGMGSFNDIAGFAEDDPLAQLATEVRGLVDDIG